MECLKLLATLCFLGSLVAGKIHYDGDKVYRITPNSNSELKFIKEWIEVLEEQLDVWKEPSMVGESIDVHVKKMDVNSAERMLNSTGVNYEVMIEDMEKMIHDEEVSNHRNAFSSYYDYEKYNRYNDIVAELSRLASKHSNVEKFDAGRSLGGKLIVGVKVTAPNSNSRKEVIWIDGCIHAREWIATATVMYLLKLLLNPPTGSSSQDTFTRNQISMALKKYDFYILPVFNVDGYEHTHVSERMWRKTRSNNGGSWCRGVDPNRNWDSHFGGAHTSTNPCSDLYRGPYPFSEREVKQVSQKLQSISRSVGLKSYWNVHAYSQLLLYPWSYTKTASRDDYEIARVARVFQLNIRKRNGKYFQPGQPSKILYTVGGGSIDWTYEKLGVKYSYAPELRPGRGSRSGFLLPAYEIRPSGLEFADGFLASVNAMK